MSEIKLDAEQEREARELAAELWQRASVCEDIADEVIALRRVAEAARAKLPLEKYWAQLHRALADAGSEKP